MSYILFLTNVYGDTGSKENSNSHKSIVCTVLCFEVDLNMDKGGEIRIAVVLEERMEWISLGNFL